ncbi:MAG: hypothetical protein ACJ71Q_00270 [Terriglobales bacterium]
MDFRDPIQKTIEEAIKPISEIVNKLVVPAAEEFGLMLGEGVGIFRDTVREYRQKRELFRYAKQIELRKRVRGMVNDVDIELQPVVPPPRLLTSGQGGNRRKRR